MLRLVKALKEWWKVRPPEDKCIDITLIIIIVALSLAAIVCYIFRL